jgi:hypothetical protein
MVVWGGTVRTELDLKLLFYQAYDSAKVAGFISRVSALAESERRTVEGFLGEGSHFQSFEVPAKPIYLAVSIAKKAFQKQGDVALRRWAEAMGVAKSLDHATLVPPLDIINQDGVVAVVMPRGQAMSRQRARAVSTMLHDTARALGQAGLVLDDYPQIFEAQGVPFIVDWSDLAFAKTSLR